MSQEHRPGTDPTPDRADAAPLPSTEPFWRTSLPSTVRVDPSDGPHLKRAIPVGVLAILALIVGVQMDGISPPQPQTFEVFGWRFTLSPTWVTIVDLLCLLVFVWAGLVAARSIWRELQRVTERRAGPAAGQAIRLLCTIGAGVAIVIGVFSILQLNLQSLLVGSAVTGVIIGIAAQQTLNNFFAGLVLFFARPYVAGQRVKVRAGSMGGPFTGVIVGAGMMYTVIDTDDEGLISMPNAGLMAAAIGPAPVATESGRSAETDDDAGAIGI
jgi:small-conductance mechanosensitive channel